MFMLKLKKSGYNEKFRKEVLDSALKAFQKMVLDDKDGVKPLFRSRDWNAEERKNLKKDKKFNRWNNKNSEIQYTTVMFVTPTPGGVLLKDLKRREKELNGNNKERIKFEEKGGLKMKDILTSKNPFKNSQCTQKTCPLCNQSEFVSADTQDVKIPCNSANVGYRWVCITCKDREINKVYVGETGRSARIWGTEHLKGLEKQNEKNVLFKHKMLDHPNEPVKFKMEITKKFKDPLTQQTNEAVRMFCRPSHEILNSKSEFNHPPLSRVVIERKKKSSA